MLDKENKLELVIPSYQRDYCWNKKNCRQLVIDIKTNRNLFIGITIEQSMSVYDRVSQKIIIDGQQRIITLFLIFLALKKISKSYNCDISGLEWYKEIKFDNYLETPKLASCDKKTQSGNYNQFAQNYESILFLLKNSISSKKEFEEFLDNFFNVYFIVWNVDDIDQVHRIYETINTRGVNLTNVDLIKNYLFMNKSYDDEKFRKYWLEWAKCPVGIDKLLKNFLTYVDDRIYSEHEVYEAFQKWNARTYEKTRSIDSVLQQISEFQDLYQDLIDQQRINSKEIRQKIEMYKTLPGSYADVFILKILKQHNLHPEALPENEVIDILNWTISIIARNILIKTSASKIRISFASLFKKIENTKNLHSDLNFFQTLLKETNDISFSLSMPSNDKIQVIFREEDFYNNQSLKKWARGFLFFLENRNKKEKIEDSDKIWIEHIMPQRLSKAWIKSLSESDVKNHNFIMDRIGNLTLTGYNQQMSNKPFQEKQVILRDKNLSKFYTIHESVINAKEWNSSMIEKRCLWLYDNFIGIFEYITITNLLVQNEEQQKEITFTLKKPIDCSRKKPISYLIPLSNNQVLKSNEFTKNWTKLFEFLAKELYNLYPNELETFAADVDVKNFANQTNATYAAGTKWHKISDKFWINTHSDTNNKIIRLSNLLNVSGVDLDKCIIKVK
ncbi:DUF262 domain-containing protein [Mycoplasma sp. 3341]|uniref:DUF262 domain-containing protein n=1 Tax=Mycoplasma sp. 3341 TaxID=3447506 RepID=UPI003F656E79